MNQEKIGQFIASERKKKKMTQLDLALKVGVTDRAVSKWETGKGLPDYSTFNNLCEALDISISELLSGERDNKNDKVIGEYMKMKGKENRVKIIVILVISFLVVLSSVLGIYFVNSYDKTNIYELSGVTDNFSFDGGLLVSSNIKNIFQKGTIQIKHDFINEEDIAESYFAFKVDDKLYKLFDYNNRVSISVEKYGQDLIIPTKMKDYIPKNLYLVVIYYKDENVHTETIKIKAKKIFSNNKFINVKSEPSNEAELELVDLNKVFNPFKYKERLLNEGFVVPTKKDLVDVYNIENVLMKKKGNEKIFIDYMNYTLYYFINYDDYYITSVPTHSLFKQFNDEFIGGVDLYSCGGNVVDGVYYNRIYSDKFGYIEDEDREVDFTKDIERYEEVNRLYAYKGE